MNQKKPPRNLGDVGTLKSATLPAEEELEDADAQSVAGSKKETPEANKWRERLTKPAQEQIEAMGLADHLKVDLIKLVIESPWCPTGKDWYTKRSYRIEVITDYLYKSQKEGYSSKVGREAAQLLSSVKFGAVYQSKNADEVGDKWNSDRRNVARHMEDVICDAYGWRKTLEQWNQRLDDHKVMDIAYIVERAQHDSKLLQYPFLHADVIIREIDDMLGQRSSKYRGQAQEHDWNNCHDRGATESLESMVGRYLSAYVKKVGDPSVTVENFHEWKTHRDTFNKRFHKGLRDDNYSEDRGLQNYAKFGAALDRQEAELNQRKISSHQACASYIVEHFIRQSESEWKWKMEGERLQHGDGHGRTKMKVAQQDSGKGSRATQLKVRAGAATSNFVTTPGSAPSPSVGVPTSKPTGTPYSLGPPPSSGDESDVVGGVVPSQPGKGKGDGRGKGGKGHSNGNGRGAYSAEPPPSTSKVALKEGLPPLKRALPADRGDRSLTKVKAPRGSKGHPYAPHRDWSMDEDWYRCMVDMNQMKDASLYTKSNAALVEAWPEDTSCRAVGSFETAGLTRMPPNGFANDNCKYCANRPRAPSDCTDDNRWYYGTGKGDHSPAYCKSLTRFLAEGGDTRKFPEAAASLQRCLTFTGWYQKKICLPVGGSQ
jgi:hypothetical protein